jgi:hypothetical protein
MYYNNLQARNKIIANMGSNPFETTTTAFSLHISLCLHPHSWETTYYSIRSKARVTEEHWGVLTGVIYALMLHTRKKARSYETINDVAIDFVEYIRSERKPDPWKFLLNMRAYMSRYMVLKGLASAGVDWRSVAYELLSAKSLPSAASYHTIFTNKYSRNMVRALGIFKNHRSLGEEDYKLGENDLQTMLERACTSRKTLPIDELECLVVYLMQQLPSWKPSIRSLVSFRVNNLIPIHPIVERQMLPSVERATVGTTSTY